MKQMNNSNSRYGILVLMILMIFTSCERNSSPEGRMSIKVENLQKEMMESMQQQNKAILDSMGKIREELNELKEKNK